MNPFDGVPPRKVLAFIWWCLTADLATTVLFGFYFVWAVSLFLWAIGV